MSATVTIVQMAINPKMPRINHPMNHLDHRSNLVSRWEASHAMGPSSKGHWRSTGNHRLRRDQRIKRDSFFKETQELRQLYNLQAIQVTECKVLLNCKFPIAITKGRGTQPCMKYERL